MQRGETTWLRREAKSWLQRKVSSVQHGLQLVIMIESEGWTSLRNIFLGAQKCCLRFIVTHELHVWVYHPFHYASCACEKKTHFLLLWLSIARLYVKWLSLAHYQPHLTEENYFGITLLELLPHILLLNLNMAVLLEWNSIGKLIYISVKVLRWLVWKRRNTGFASAYRGKVLQLSES